MKIMIVDDSTQSRDFFTSLLSDLQIECIECQDGQDAVERYQEVKPDVVLMDIRMPRMGGFEALQKIRQVDRNASIAMITQFNEEEYRVRAKNLGASAFFLKDNPSEVYDFVMCRQKENQLNNNFNQTC